MMPTLMLVSCLLLSQTKATGATAEKVIIATEVKRLVRQLDANEASQRDAAEKALIALGADALDHLPQITPRTAAEVKERLGRIRKFLQSATAQSSAKESLVTLDGKMSLEKALAALEKQTGNRVVGFEDRDVNVEVNFDKVAYWSALDQILDQAGMTVNEYGGEVRALTIEARPAEMRARASEVAYAGPFRFEATRIESVLDLRNPATNGLKLGLAVSWEPRLVPIGVTQKIEQLEIKDDQGRTMAIDEEQALAANVEADITSVELIIPLKLPDREIRKIASIKGTLSALLPGRVESFEFEKLEGVSDVEQQRAGVTVTLEQVRKNQEIFEVRVVVRFDEASNALESHRGWVYENEAYMLGANGQRIERVGFETTRSDKNEVGMAYLFDLDKGLKGCKFVYKTPSSVVSMPVTFELHDVKLP